MENTPIAPAEHPERKGLKSYLQSLVRNVLGEKAVQLRMVVSGAERVHAPEFEVAFHNSTGQQYLLIEPEVDAAIIETDARAAAELLGPDKTLRSTKILRNWQAKWANAIGAFFENRDSGKGTNTEKMAALLKQLREHALLLPAEPHDAQGALYFSSGRVEGIPDEIMKLDGAAESLATREAMERLEAAMRNELRRK